MAHAPIHSLTGANRPDGAPTSLDRPQGPPSMPDLSGLVDGKPGDEALLIYTGLHQWGRETALWSGALRPDPVLLKALIAEAMAAADRLAAASYDPAQNAADGLMQARYLEQVQLALETRDRIAQAERLTDEKRAARASLGEEPQRPDDRVVLVVGTLATAIPVGLALHEGATRLWLDDPAAAFAAAAGATLLAALPVTTLVRSAAVETPDERPMRGLWLGVCGALAGVVYLVAASAAQDGADHLRAASYALGAGLCLVATALYTYGVARSHARYRERRAPWMAATQAIHAAERREAEARGALADCEAKIAEHDEQVRRREHHRRQAELIRKAAGQAVEAGYLAGIAENRGEGGASVRAPTTREVREHQGLPQSTPTPG
ncbi:hypothetical protein L6R53_00755 [Myxococcota bacterium]|nr:hypothetical protein [Myxococcota bacterium]